MKKLTFLVTNSEKQSFIEQLRGFGIVHVVELQKGATSPKLQAALDADERFRQVLKVLENVDGTRDEGQGTNHDAFALMDRVETLKQEEEQLQQQLTALLQTAEELRPLGQYDLNRIREIEALTGLKMAFFSCFNKSFAAEWEEKYFATILAKDKTTTWFVVFAEEQPEIAATPIELPAQDIAYFEAEIQKTKAALEKNAAELVDIALNGKATIEAAKAENDGNISLARVQLSSTEFAEGELHLMEGWVPAEKADAVCEALTASHIFFEMEEPTEEDLVPIKLKNSFLARAYERIVKMYGFPCYQEWDPTILVAPFFTLFFAICMGDAGYGMLILAYGIFESKGKAKNTPILGEMLAGCGDIITYLGIATIIIGLCLGSFFGMDLVNIGWVPKDTAYGGMITWLNGNFPGTNYSMKMVVAIVIGVFHLCFAMVIKAVMFSQRYGFKSQFSVWGWILLIIGGIVTTVLSMTSVLSEEVTKVVLIVIASVSALGIYIFNDVKRNPLANISSGLIDTYNMVTGLLGDVLSYLRLYALCLAGGMLGGAFNMMGDMVRDLADGLPVYLAVLIWLCAFIVYAFGHLFNVLMSSISAFVHPLRLVFVEYFKNSGYEGRGIAYKPFK